MKFKVIHKGIIIVFLPLILELLVLAWLFSLLQEIDASHERLTINRRLARDCKQLLLSNFKVGNCLTKVWLTRDPNSLKELNLEFANTKNLCQRIRTQSPAKDPSGGLLKGYLEAEENLVIPELEHMAEISKEISLTNYVELRKSQNRINNCLARVNQFADQKFKRRIDEGFENEKKRITQLQNNTDRLLIIAFLLNCALAFCIYRFFRSNFTERLQHIQINTQAFAEGGSLSPPLQGSDEIKELDEAIHNMARQISATAEKEKLLFERSGELICEISKDLRFSRVNGACHSIWNVSKESLQNCSIADVMRQEDFAMAQKILSQSGQPSESVKFESGKYDSKASYLWSASWSQTQQMWYCSIHDVTEEQESLKQKQSFLRMISADFSKPLERMFSLFDGLLNGELGKLPESSRSRYANSQNSLKRLCSLVAELLQLEEIQSSTSSPILTPCNVCEILDSAYNDVLALAQSKKIAIDLDCSKSLSCLADRDQIVRVLMNLLSNAIKFSPMEATVLVSAYLQSGEIVVEIKDHGRGIPASKQAELFQAYKQVRKSDGQRSKGTGLGLVICKKIIESHGGKIQVQSVENEGSCFSISLPAEQSSQIAKQDKPDGTIVREEPRSDLGVVQEEAFLSNSRNNEQVNKTQNLSLPLSAKAVFLAGTPLSFQAIFVVCMLLSLYQGKTELTKEIRDQFMLASALDLTVSIYPVVLLNKKVDKAFIRQHVEQFQAKRQQIDENLSKTQVGRTYLPALQRAATEVEKTIGGISAFPEQYSQRRTMLMASMYELDRIVLLLVSAFDSSHASIDRRREIRRQQDILLLAGLMLNTSIAGIMAVYFSKDLNSRLKVLVANSRLYAESLPLLTRLPGNDEIAKLDQAFHNMAARVSAGREKENAVLENSADLICSFDKDFLVTACNNSAALRLLHMPSRSVLGKSLFELLPEEQAIELKEKMLELKSRDSGLLHFEANVLDTAFVVLSINWSVLDKGYFCVARDITQQKELERLRKEFLAVVSHDLRTPLSSIMMLIDMGEVGAFGQLSEQTLSTFNKINDDCRLVLELSNDLLDIAKLDAGQMQLELAHTELSYLLDRSLEYLEEQSWRGEPEVYVTESEQGVLVDLERLASAIANLLLELMELPVEKISMDWRVNNDALEVIIRTFLLNNGDARAEEVCRRLNQENGKDFSEQSRKSRLRVPLTRKIIEAHNIVLNARHVESKEIEIGLRFPRERIRIKEAELN